MDCWSTELIGVIAKSEEMPVAEEFFELFKTPWEPCKIGRRYDVVLSTLPGTLLPENTLTIICGTNGFGTDTDCSLHKNLEHAPTMLCYGEKRFPLYGELSTFGTARPALVTREDTGEAVALEMYGLPSKRIRIGYSIFREISFLLTIGQPVEHATHPTLETHISILRNLIVGSGLPLVEIPPVPPGHNFILCLTHDVDFASIRLHRGDRTLMGFIYRASIRSLVRFLQGQLSFGKLLKNWLSVLSLPLVHMSLVNDCFNQFGRYLQLEGNVKSTFFLVPHKDMDGLSPGGYDSRGRATRYDVDDVKEEIAAVLATGCEVGLHAIDAWHDLPRAREERARIGVVTNEKPVGVRVHWLFFSAQTPKVLEDAGFSYDATWGYNNGVGFRAGTAQAFRPVGSEKLLELPLNIQDTALFSSGRMGLTQDQGIREIEKTFKQMREIGGALTVNWHLRSIGPERWWDDSYRHLLRYAESPSVWTATAREVVEWFSLRRSTRFSELDPEQGSLEVSVVGNPNVPALQLRLHNLSHDGTVRVAAIPFSSDISLNGVLPRGQ